MMRIRIVYIKKQQRRRDLEYEIRKDKKSMAKENNKDRILKLLKECKNHQTAESIAVQLNIQRNTASGILNELVREGIVQKEKT